MNSSFADSIQRSLRSRVLRLLLPSSIVARTTVSIALLASLVGALVASTGAWMIHGSEEARLRSQLSELLSTVESTVSIACYVKDEALAREIGVGLMNNRVLSGVSIQSDSGALYQQFRADAQAQPSAGMLVISRQVHSPFEHSEVVGEIRLYAAESDIQRQAWIYTRFVVLVLTLEVALVALAVAWVVFSLVTRPIKGISDELHRLEVRTGVHLQVPINNQQDEIGRLVGDVNALIAELSHLLDTERRLHLQHETSERRLTLIFEKVDAGLFEIDEQGLLHSWNPAFVRALGTPPDPPSLRSMMAGQAQLLDQLVRSCLASAAQVESDFELADHAGAAQWVELSLTPMDHGLLQGVINDITERKRSEQAAQQLAISDALTGLLNRRGLDLGLKAAFERRRHEPGLRIALIQIDLDWFKQVNDCYGHDAGDVVLRHVASLLAGLVRRSDLVARAGGDEFTVALIGIGSIGEAESIAAKLLESLGRPIDVGAGAQARIGASIGIALVEDGDEPVAIALRRADEAMYVAKRGGRNGLYVAPLSTPGANGSPPI